MTKKRKPGGDRRLLSLGVATNERLRMDGVDLMERLPDRIAKVVFLDPQYRHQLDEMAFGNEGARQKARAKLPQMTDATIRHLVNESERVLHPSGHLMLWMDKFTLVEGLYRRWLRGSKLRAVDLIAWDKLRPGMGRRARCQTEYLVVVQKEPVRAKDVWTDHSIRDSHPEHHDRGLHPHCKPHRLTEQLIRAVTQSNDLVVDPCAGGFGVMEACLRSGRVFLGCDVNG